MQLRLTFLLHSPHHQVKRQYGRKRLSTLTAFTLLLTQGKGLFKHIIELSKLLK